MLSVSIHELAESELHDAADYYESKVKGLGISFIVEIERAVKVIQQDPESSPRILSIVLKKVIRRFPYSIMYSIIDNSIYILSIANHKRRPYYWRNRK